MNYILTERLRVRVPDLGDLEAHKLVLETMLKERHSPSDAERASALTDFGRVKHRSMPHLICLRESPEWVGVIKMTMNLDAFIMTEREGKMFMTRDKPLEIGLHVVIHRQYRGNGYGLEAAKAFADYAMSVLAARRVVAEARRSEPRALRLMERLDMESRPEPRPDHPHRVVGVLYKED